MGKYESSIKHIPYPQKCVYDTLSDLSNIERVKDRIPEDKQKDLSFDKDSIAITAPMVGKIAMRIIEREEPKTIKFESVDSPLPFNLWIQLLPDDNDGARMKLTLKADIPLFAMAMVNKPLQEGIEKAADALAAIPYQ